MSFFPNLCAYVFVANAHALLYFLKKGKETNITKITY